jgi:hypothetical protein
MTLFLRLVSEPEKATALAECTTIQGTFHRLVVSGQTKLKPTRQWPLRTAHWFWRHSQRFRPNIRFT